MTHPLLCLCVKVYLTMVLLEVFFKLHVKSQLAYAVVYPPFAFQTWNTCYEIRQKANLATFIKCSSHFITFSDRFSSNLQNTCPISMEMAILPNNLQLEYYLRTQVAKILHCWERNCSWYFLVSFHNSPTCFKMCCKFIKCHIE